MLLYLFFRKLYEASSTASMRKEFSDMQLIHEKVNYTMLIQNIGKTYTWSEELKPKLISDGNKPLKIWNTRQKQNSLDITPLEVRCSPLGFRSFTLVFFFNGSPQLSRVDTQESKSATAIWGTSRFSQTLLIIPVVFFSIPVSTGSRCCYFCWWIGHHLPSSSFILS